MLIDSNILDLQKMHLDYEHERLIIGNCKEMFVSIKVILIKNKMNRMIRILIVITISFKCSTIISMRLRGNTQLS